MTKRILYPIVFALLLLLGGWGSKASGQSSGATYAVRYTLPKGVSDLRCVTYFPPEGKVVVTSGRKIPAGEQLTFTATVEDGYEIDHWLVNGKLAQHEPEAYGGAKIMEMEMPGEDIDVVIVMKQPETASDECTVRLTPSTSDGGMLSAYYLERNPFTGDEEETYINDGDRVPKFTILKATAVPYSGYTIGQWYQDGVAIEGSKGRESVSVVVRDNTEIKVDFESSGQSFEGVVFTFQEDTPEGTITAYYEDDNFNHKAFHSGDKVPMGKMAYFTATPKAGYEFDYWTLNGEKGSRYLMVVDEHTCKLTAEENDTIGAVFKQTTPAGHKITLTAGEGGTLQCSLTNGTEVQSGSTVDDGVALRFNARPMNGYKTDQWTINGEPYTRGKGKNTIIQRADKDLNVEVSFLKDIKLYTVEYVAGEGGTIAATVGTEAKAIQSNDQVEQGAVITFTATPQEGYELDHWMVNGKPAVAGADTKIEGNKLIVTLGDQNLKVEATFKKLPVTYEVTYSAGEGGDIIGTTFNGRTTIPSGSKVDENVYMRFTAKPNTEQDYKVDQWFVNGEVQSQLAGRPYIMWQIKAKTDVKVTFKKEQMYEVDYKPDNEWGTIEAYYYDRGRKVAVEPKAMIKEGTFVEFQATVKEGYALDGWTNNGEEIPVADIETLKASITLRANAVIDVKYHKLVVKYSVTYTAGEGGRIVGLSGDAKSEVASGSKVDKGTMVRLLALPDAEKGYMVDQWTINGEVKPEYTGKAFIIIPINTDTKISVSFKKQNKYKVFFTSDNEWGKLTAKYSLRGLIEVESGQELNEGTIVFFSASVKDGYEIDSWTCNGEPIKDTAPTEAKITLKADSHIEVQYHKLVVKHAVTFTAGEGGTVAATVGTEAKAIESNDQVEQGAVITFTATPQEGYELDQWMADGKPAVAGTDTKIEGNKLIVTLGDQDLKVEATFKKLIVKHTVTFTAGEGGTIAATVGAEAKAIQSKDQVEQGAVITFTATPQEGYELDQWMVDGKPAVAGADTKIEGNKLIVTLGDQDLKVEVTFRKGNAISQISEAELAVYPNPFAERIVITIPAECIGQTAYLTSMQGEIVLQMTLDQVETVLYTDALSHGTYLLRVGSQSQLLIKE